jgi:hypothetical protein
MASGSGCAHVDSPVSYLCSFTVTGLPPGPANVINYGYWTVKFQCVAPRSGKPGPRSQPAYAIVHGINISHNQVNSVNGEITARGIQVLPPSEADASPYLCQVAPYTQAKFLEKFKPYGWRILAMWALDINNYYVSLEEVY